MDNLDKVKGRDCSQTPPEEYGSQKVRSNIYYARGAVEEGRKELGGKGLSLKGFLRRMLNLNLQAVSSNFRLNQATRRGY